MTRTVVINPHRQVRVAVLPPEDGHPASVVLETLVRRNGHPVEQISRMILRPRCARQLARAINRTLREMGASADTSDADGAP